jgi:chloramphenicol-sensitive protein RarD
MSQRTSTAASGLAAAVRAPDAARSGAPANIAPANAEPANDAQVNGAPPATSATGAVTTNRKLAAEGLLAAVVAFIIWGAFPVYLKPLHDVPPLQIIAHRIAWACVLVLAWLFARGELGDLRKPLTNPAILGRLTVSAFLITVNWLAYVWGVVHGHVVETSLGYFINPLCNVLLGVIVLRERLNFAQWSAVGIATAAVLYLAVATGSTPWIALTVAVSFSIYGLIRKIVPVEALQGLAVETLVLMPVALGYLVWCEATGTGALGHSSSFVNTLLVGCGAITAVPLFLFAFAARLIPYSTVGLLLYIAPSLQLLCGIFLYHEPFAGARAQGFALIWLALLIYAGDGMWRARGRRQPEGLETTGAARERAKRAQRA